MGSKTIGIVAINETEFLTEKMKEMVGGEYYTLYAFDPSEEVHLCEITPSYYLIPFDYASKRLLDDEEDSEHASDLMGDPIHMHCRAINGFPEDLKTTVEIEWDDETDTFEDKAIDYLRGNPSHPDRLMAL